ncbi:MAG: tripartite tricarboxylate transporter TctB family protein [Betaproteobacteria bacterium]|nr:MAG: tripartite tricarboxylate transporter TctB family protein [Betaproteobacteria bacterium]
MRFIRHPKDFYAGLIFIAFGVAAIVIGNNYALGTAARMGPGYFPRILGILLIVLGSALSLRGLRLHGNPIPAWKWRPTLIVLGSVVLFGLIVTHLGLVISTIVLIVLSSAASHEFRPRESLVSGVLLAALAVGVFVIGLKLQLPVWPWTNSVLPWSN